MSKELRKDLLLVAVTEVENEKFTLDFLSEEEGMLYEVSWNLRKWDNEASGNNKWVQSDEQEANVAKWAKEVFDVDVSELKNLGDKGIRKDVYHYGTFNSLWEVSRIEKFDKSRVGEIFPVTVSAIEEDNKGIQVKFEEEGKTYSINFGTSKYMETLNRFVTDPVKRHKSLEKFQDTFGVPFEQSEVLIGQEIMIEVKLAFGKFVYTEAKKLSQKVKDSLIAKV